MIRHNRFCKLKIRSKKMRSYNSIHQIHRGDCSVKIRRDCYDKDFPAHFNDTLEELSGVRLKFIARSFAVDPKLFGKFKHPKHAEIMAYPHAWDLDC